MGCNFLVGGERLLVVWMGGWRVWNGFCWYGFLTMLMNILGLVASRFGALMYWYVWLENGIVNLWIVSVVWLSDEVGWVFDKWIVIVYYFDLVVGCCDFCV